MSGGLEIDISTNIEDMMMIFIDELSDKELKRSVKASINKTLRAGRKTSLKLIHKKLSVNSRAMTRTDFKKNQTFLNKARGSSAFDMQGSLVFSGNAMPLLWFVSGNIDNIKQKGVKVKKRRKLKAQVFRGKKFTVKGGFIQKSRTKQVFKSGGKGFKKQGIPSLAHFMRHKGMMKTMQKLMLKTFQKQMLNQMKFRVDKIAKKSKRARLKLPK